MGRKGSAVSTVVPRILLAGLLLLGMLGAPGAARAEDLPLASGSSMVGIRFSDRPLILPVQRNFQMAMLTAGSELGRSCGKMEAYGWRMGQSEQQRVDRIFNDTVDRLRGLGYVVQAQEPSAVANDITVFTADKTGKHFVFMWSAGEIGLVMVLCQSSPPLTSHEPAPAYLPPATSPTLGESVMATDLGQSPPVETAASRAAAAKFSPVGDWVGNYICAQGYTGGTLEIKSLHDGNFTGLFRFYPTARNPYVPNGSYTVYGQYDRASHRILINPGKWIKRPQNFYNTIMIGNFDPLSRTFSAFFQGITGCTSFEARAASAVHEVAENHYRHYRKSRRRVHRKARHVRHGTAHAKPHKKVEKKIVHKKAPEKTVPKTAKPAAPQVTMPAKPTAPAVPSAQKIPSIAPAKPPAPAPVAPALAKPAPAPATPEKETMPPTLPALPPPPSVAPSSTSTPPATKAAPAESVRSKSGASFVAPPALPMPAVPADKAATAPLATSSTPAASPPLPASTAPAAQTP
ncbi:MAG TPA: hypothetical protein VMV79_00050 [Alphaproteobacteria bacterium]|nr:hypothetical protein [Alphaproteobacteria bacterium]